MHFLSFGEGHAGGVCSFTDYTQADQDGAWVGLERYPHPTDSQYSWVYRLAEVYSARAKSFCRHGACIESILQEVSESINMYEFDECYYFIGLPSWKKRLYSLYGSWGSAKDHRWSKDSDTYGIDCNMDGLDFDREYGKQLIINMLMTNGVKPKDTTFKSYYDLEFGSMLGERGLNLGDKADPMVQYHPDNEQFDSIIDEWLDIKEKRYLEECKRVESIKSEHGMNVHWVPELMSLLEKVKESKHKFFFYFTDEIWPMPKPTDKYKFMIGDEELDLNHENIYWFWKVCMDSFFKNNLENATPRIHGYYRHEDHYQFSKYMRRNITENNLI